MDVFEEIKRWLPGFTPGVVVDAGAFTGNFSRRAREAWDAKVYAFEPSLRNFARLIGRVDAGVIAYNVALGMQDAVGFVETQPDPSMDRVVMSGDGGGKAVEIQKLDGLGLPDIDFLKIDTEGSDLHVLRGARQMLSEGRIGLVQVEAGMNPDNQWHVPARYFHSMLEPMGFRLFSIGETAMEWPEKKPYMRRADLVFISPRLIEEYRGKGWA